MEEDSVAETQTDVAILDDLEVHLAASKIAEHVPAGTYLKIY